MSQDFAVQVLYQGVFAILLISMPAVGIGLLVGFLVSLFQAVTQIQEQTLTFVPKLVAVIVTLALVGPWTMIQLVNYANSLMDSFPTYIK